MAKLAVAAGVVVVLLVAAYTFWSRNRCERACATAEREARALYDRGEWAQALLRLDEADARCDCARFTRGDEPPEESLARACLKELVRHGQEAEARRLKENARGALLRALPLP